jgi:tetratricopeptide (TPR) repeat protein
MVEGKLTQDYASKLALELAPKMKNAAWSLVSKLEHVPLYEAIPKVIDDEGDYSYETATMIYLYGLIAANRAEDAVAVVMRERDAKRTITVSSKTLDRLGDSGLRPQVHAFLSTILARDPSVPLWSDLITVAAQQGKSADALALMRGTLAQPNLSRDIAKAINPELFKALLAADEVDAGIAMLREVIAQPQGAKSTLELLSQLAALGKVLARPELVDAAIAQALKLPWEAADGADVRHEHFVPITDLMIDAERWEQVSDRLSTEIARLGGPRSTDGHHVSHLLPMLVHVDHQLGRHDAVIALLDGNAHWGHPDLGDFMRGKEASRILVESATAFAAKGRIDEARRIIRRAVQADSGSDAAMALFVKLGTEGSIESELDALAARDRFEERPLIWKARVQLDAGRIDEAEETIRAAITIDPSDGEQGKGDRMRAYAVLAEVLDKKGDADTAKIMRGAVSAIRKSEAADDWWSAGLLTQAVKRYEEALLDFANAYCIQSRLALRYSNLGDHEKAEQHYMRAFELMPDSFGRVESHCFGCEGAFSSERAQNAAEKVFTKLAEQPTPKAQVFYLLGYLRDSQERPAEAADAYRKALKIDPDYLNAWSNLLALDDEIGLPPEERDQATSAILRLDPARNHCGVDFDGMRRFDALWDTIFEVEKQILPAETGPIYPLAAAAAKSRTSAPSSAATPTLRGDTLRSDVLESAVLRPVLEILEGAHLLEQP